jgi:uncharacterized protein with HEPN domain
MLDYNLYKNVILEMISKLENSFYNLEEKEFLKNSEIQDATLMRLQVIGENIKRIPSKSKTKELNWKKFEKLRNLISHRYDTIDYKIVYNFVTKNLPELKKAIKNIKNG